MIPEILKALFLLARELRCGNIDEAEEALDTVARELGPRAVGQVKAGRADVVELPGYDRGRR